MEHPLRRQWWNLTLPHGIGNIYKLKIAHVIHGNVGISQRTIQAGVVAWQWQASISRTTIWNCCHNAGQTMRQIRHNQYPIRVGQYCTVSFCPAFLLYLVCSSLRSAWHCIQGLYLIIRAQILMTFHLTFLAR